MWTSVSPCLVPGPGLRLGIRQGFGDRRLLSLRLCSELCLLDLVSQPCESSPGA